MLAAMRQRLAFAAAVLFSVNLWAAPEAPATAPPDDRFLAGYVAAVIERDFRLAPAIVSVDRGVVRVIAKDLGAADRQRLLTSLQQIRGVSRVEIVEGQPASNPAPANEVTPNPSGPGVETKAQPRSWTLFSSTSFFQPLVADPRWPNFSAAYDRYLTSGPQKLKDVGSVSFGESLSLFQTAPKPAGQFELGIQAAVFAIFNLNADSKDLINADYFVGPIAEYRNGDFSGFLRVYHQSSHLGDEFLLNHPGIKRVNLSYEEVDAIASYDLFDKTLRVYGGGGYLFDTDPTNLKHLAVQYGIEYRGPRIFPSFGMIPIAAIDLQNREQNEWSLDLSARAGVQFEDPATLSRQVQLLVEYYNGHSPNGQFFTERVQFIGLGLHFYP
ncbi:MAG: uncharacterized protein JWM97_2712 [Phycisphaerales bacterium]|nr:uncharacterized protein [Phycisphaerales bacterium]